MFTYIPAPPPARSPQTGSPTIPPRNFTHTSRSLPLINVHAACRQTGNLIHSFYYTIEAYATLVFSSAPPIFWGDEIPRAVHHAKIQEGVRFLIPILESLDGTAGQRFAPELSSYPFLNMPLPEQHVGDQGWAAYYMYLCNGIQAFQRQWDTSIDDIFRTDASPRKEMLRDFMVDLKAQDIARQVTAKNMLKRLHDIWTDTVVGTPFPMSFRASPITPVHTPFGGNRIILRREPRPRVRTNSQPGARLKPLAEAASPLSMVTTSSENATLGITGFWNEVARDVPTDPLPLLTLDIPSLGVAPTSSTDSDSDDSDAQNSTGSANFRQGPLSDLRDEAHTAITTPMSVVADWKATMSSPEPAVAILVTPASPSPPKHVLTMQDDGCGSPSRVPISIESQQKDAPQVLNEITHASPLSPIVSLPDVEPILSLSPSVRPATPKPSSPRTSVISSPIATPVSTPSSSPSASPISLASSLPLMPSSPARSDGRHFPMTNFSRLVTPALELSDDDDGAHGSHRRLSRSVEIVERHGKRPVERRSNPSPTLPSPPRYANKSVDATPTHVTIPADRRRSSESRSKKSRAESDQHITPSRCSTSRAACCGCLDHHPAPHRSDGKVRSERENVALPLRRASTAALDASRRSTQESSLPSPPSTPPRLSGKYHISSKPKPQSRVRPPLLETRLEKNNRQFLRSAGRAFDAQPHVTVSVVDQYGSVITNFTKS